MITHNIWERRAAATAKILLALKSTLSQRRDFPEVTTLGQHKGITQSHLLVFSAFLFVMTRILQSWHAVSVFSRCLTLLLDSSQNKITLQLKEQQRESFNCVTWLISVALRRFSRFFGRQPEDSLILNFNHYLFSYQGGFQ